MTTPTTLQEELDKINKNILSSKPGERYEWIRKREGLLLGYNLGEEAGFKRGLKAANNLAEDSDIAEEPTQAKKSAEEIFREQADVVGFPKREQDHFVDIFLKADAQGDGR